MNVELWLTTAVVAITILLWATSLLPEFITALLFFAAAMVFKVAPADTIFSGFASSAFWLVFSGFVLGVAIKKVGLADRLAQKLSRHLTQSWPAMVGGVMLLTYALAFVMPSNMGRIALLVPVIGAMAKQAGIAEGSKGWIGLMLAVGFGTFALSASILPANVPNLVLAGAAENAWHQHLTFMPWLLLHTPVTGWLKGGLITLCIIWLFPARPQPVHVAAVAAPLRRDERRLLVVLLLTLLLWATDSWHGISPAWIGLVAACFCLLPRVGFVNGEAFANGVNFRTCLYVGGILGLAALVVQSGLGQRVGDAVQHFAPLSPQHPWLSFLSLTGITSVLNFVLTANGVPAMYTPMAESLSQASGFSLMTVMMIQVFAYATPLLPYQASPIVVAMGLGKVPAKEGIRFCLIVSGLSMLLLLPLNYLWFSLLGYL